MASAECVDVTEEDNLIVAESLFRTLLWSKTLWNVPDELESDNYGKLIYAHIWPLEFLEHLSKNIWMLRVIKRIQIMIIWLRVVCFFMTWYNSVLVQKSSFLTENHNIDHLVNGREFTRDMFEPICGKWMSYVWMSDVWKLQTVTHYYECACIGQADNCETLQLRD